MKHNRVFVIDKQGNPLMPCHPARARQMLREKRAVVARRMPFTIRILDRVGGNTQDLRLKIDPGAKITGVALVASFEQQKYTVVWAGELAHRGELISKRMTSRREHRRSLRNRKTRYRPPRFLNRKKPKGWLPPSLEHRVATTMTWVKRLQRWSPVTCLSLERVRFDTQKLQNPEISGMEYQRGELFGYEIREYLLEKWGRQCAYCGAEEVPLEIDHLVPRSRGGTDRVSNLTIACHTCNQEKGNRDVQVFMGSEYLKKQRLKIKRLKKKHRKKTHCGKSLDAILSQAKQPLTDAAAVNATRNRIYQALDDLDLPLEIGTGGRTKWNRSLQYYPKTHWIDAACVGVSGESVRLDPGLRPLSIASTGRGCRQVVKMNKKGFPRTKAGRIKRVKGFQTGDLVRLVQPKGKYAGTHIGRLAGIRADGRFDIQAPIDKITSIWHRFTLLQRADGYCYE